MRSDDVPSVCRRLSGFLNVTSWQRRLQQPPRCEILRHGDARAHVSRKRRRCLTRDRSFLCISGVVRRSRMSTKKSNKQYLGSRLLLPPDKYEVRGSPSPIISFHSPFIRSPPVRFVLNFQPHRREGRQEGRERGDLLLLYNTQLPQQQQLLPFAHKRDRARGQAGGWRASSSNATPRAAPPRPTCLPFLGRTGIILRLRMYGFKSNLTIRDLLGSSNMDKCCVNLAPS